MIATLYFYPLPEKRVHVCQQIGAWVAVLPQQGPTILQWYRSAAWLHNAHKNWYAFVSLRPLYIGVREYPFHSTTTLFIQAPLNVQGSSDI